MSPTLAARRARVARIRRAVAAATVAIFIALYATIYIQMAAGKNPALATSTTTTQVSTTSSDATTASDDSSTAAEPMTTAQS
jgi:hypothetical protein